MNFAEEHVLINITTRVIRTWEVLR